MFTQEQLHAFSQNETPFYFYDMELLDRTLALYTEQLRRYGYRAHYAMKANANDKILEKIRQAGLGADCVSGNEVSLALKSGFDPQKIVYAGVGKSDKEILTALRGGIFNFNCESVPEIQIIDEIAAGLNVKAPVSLRINPDIDAHTHRHINTGRSRDKFGISTWMFPEVLHALEHCRNIELKGLHFHVGSQITDLSVFELLCTKVNEFQEWFADHGIGIEHVNLGGGLGIDYVHPLENPIAPFEQYFALIHKNLMLRPGQQVHLEPGRALVGPCGFLISRVLYVKIGRGKQFAILDAGMNDLIRPALYQAMHHICNLTAAPGRERRYDVVGPVCESSDRFGLNILLPHTQRGDLIAICSAGAYGQVMAMRYNQRDLAKAYYSTDL